MRAAKPSSTVGSNTYNKIKQDIIFGKLAPGQKMKLEPLKQRYETSSSTLRETLNRLVSEGFVEAPEQRGFFVKPVSRDDLIEIANLRVLLECHALRLSIAQGDTEWEGDLVAAYHKLKVMEEKIIAGDDSNTQMWKRYDWEFHLTMIKACNSENLLSLHATLYDKYLRYQSLVLTNRGAVAAQEHKDMFDAALERETDQAVSLLEKHIMNGLDHTLGEMST